MAFCIVTGTAAKSVLEVVGDDVAETTATLDVTGGVDKVELAEVAAPKDCSWHAEKGSSSAVYGKLEGEA